jgi:hypothetical protein
MALRTDQWNQVLSEIRSRKKAITTSQYVNRAINGNEIKPRFIKIVKMTIIIAVILSPEEVPVLPIAQRYCFWCIFEDEKKLWVMSFE